MFSWLINHRLHHVIQDVHPGFPCPGNGLLDNGSCKAVDLDIHLDGSDTVLCTAHLKVHVAEEIFQALDISQHKVIIIRVTGYQAAGDTGHHLFNRNAGRHQGQGGRTDACLGCGTVGFHCL